MIVNVASECSAGCGVRVRGRVDTESREFIHRFTLPAGAEALVSSLPTEVEGARLVTFGPGEDAWSVPCPVCRAPIEVPSSP